MGVQWAEQDNVCKKFCPLCRSSKAKVQKALKYLGHVYAGSRQKLTKKSVLDAITWHHYYMNGHTATIQDFLGLIFSMNLTHLCSIR